MSGYPQPPIVDVWGEDATDSGDMVQPTDAQIDAGWPESATPPARQYFNWLFYFCTLGIRYLSQRGLTDWNTGETYQINARVIGDDGNTYVSLQNANTAHTPSTSGSWWALWGLTFAQIDSAIAAGDFVKANSAGQKVQSGSGTSSSDPYTVTFPEAFSGTPKVVATADATTVGISLASVSSTEFTMQIAASANFQWIAVGPA